MNPLGGQIGAEGEGVGEKQPELFDIHVMIFAGDPQSTIEGLQRFFAIDRATARRLVEDVPVVVKRAAEPDVAAEMLDVLGNLGAQVVLLPAASAVPSGTSLLELKAPSLTPPFSVALGSEPRRGARAPRAGAMDVVQEVDVVAPQAVAPGSRAGAERAPNAAGPAPAGEQRPAALDEAPLRSRMREEPATGATRWGALLRGAKQPAPVELVAAAPMAEVEHETRGEDSRDAFEHDLALHDEPEDLAGPSAHDGTLVVAPLFDPDERPPRAEPSRPVTVRATPSAGGMSGARELDIAPRSSSDSSLPPALGAPVSSLPPAAVPTGLDLGLGSVPPLPALGAAPVPPPPPPGARNAPGTQALGIPARGAPPPVPGKPTPPKVPGLNLAAGEQRALYERMIDGVGDGAKLPSLSPLSAPERKDAARGQGDNYWSDRRLAASAAEPAELEDNPRLAPGRMAGIAAQAETPMRTEAATRPAAQSGTQSPESPARVRSLGRALTQVGGGAGVFLLFLQQDNSILLGNANLLSIAAHGLAVFVIGLGIWELRT